MGTQFNGANSPNQFKQGPVVGQLDMRTGSGQTMACQIDTTSAGSLLPSQPVKVVDSGGGIPKIVECSGQSDDCFGLIVFDKKRSSYAVGDIVDVAFGRGTVMYVNAGAAAARNAKAELVVSLTNPRFQTQTSTHTILGRFLDKPAALNDLVRLELDLPGVTPQP